MYLAEMQGPVQSTSSAVDERVSANVLPISNGSSLYTLFFREVFMWKVLQNAHIKYTVKQ